ncbi:DEAD/DEAH box helicase, partial [bacterium]|nr:DEAD/DEAH box helicase [bacterium]
LVNHSLGRSFLGFAKRYCDAKKGDFGWETKGASNLDQLTVQLHGTMLRRTKDEVLDLPGKMRTWLTVEIPATTARRGMRRILQTLMKGDGDAANAKQKLPPISRTELIARLTTVRSDIAGAKMKHSVEFAKGIVDQGEKVVIYTCFQEVAETIVESFDGHKVRWLTGAASAEHRQKAVDDFQNDDSVRVFVATVIAGGVGITLTAARTVIFNDLDWVPANHWQAEDRVYRIGQTHAVNVYYFKAANSIDEFVGQVLETKTNMINAVVDGESIVGPDASLDMLGELERAFGGLGLSKKLTDSQIDTALSRAAEDYSSTDPAIASVVVVAADPLHKPKTVSAASIRALAAALAPPQTAAKYRIASSKEGQFYEVEVDGTDVACSCLGFEFRGQCKHARTLKEALANGQEVPGEYTPL